MSLIFAALLAVVTQTPPKDLPLCAQPTHPRLLVRPGYDACGPALDAQGRPLAVGLMPATCPSGADRRVDAVGPQDRCVTPNPSRPK